MALSKCPGCTWQLALLPRVYHSIHRRTHGTSPKATGHQAADESTTYSDHEEEATEKRLQNLVLCPDDKEMQTFEMWWKSLDDEDVEVKFPYERHGLAGCPSNHSKLDVMANFLEFVDLNSQPNGRHTGSYSAQFFFIPKFSRIAPPRSEG